MPYVLAAYFMGQSFLLFLGGLVGLALMTLAARKKFLVPKDKWQFPLRDVWPEDWRSGVEKDTRTLDMPAFSEISSARPGCPTCWWPCCWC